MAAGGKGLRRPNSAVNLKKEAQVQKMVLQTMVQSPTVAYLQRENSQQNLPPKPKVQKPNRLLSNIPEMMYQSLGNFNPMLTQQNSHQKRVTSASSERRTQHHQQQSTEQSTFSPLRRRQQQPTRTTEQSNQKKQRKDSKTRQSSKKSLQSPNINKVKVNQLDELDLSEIQQTSSQDLQQPKMALLKTTKSMKEAIFNGIKPQLEALTQKKKYNEVQEKILKEKEIQQKQKLQQLKDQMNQQLKKKMLQKKSSSQQIVEEDKQQLKQIKKEKREKEREDRMETIQMIKQTIKETEQMTLKINKLSRPFSAKQFDKQEMLIKVPTAQTEIIKDFQFEEDKQQQLNIEHFMKKQKRERSKRKKNEEIKQQVKDFKIQQNIKTLQEKYKQLNTKVSLKINRKKTKKQPLRHRSKSKKNFDDEKENIRQSMSPKSPHAHSQPHLAVQQKINSPIENKKKKLKIKQQDQQLQKLQLNVLDLIKSQQIMFKTMRKSDNNGGTSDIPLPHVSSEFGSVFKRKKTSTASLRSANPMQLSQELIRSPKQSQKSPKQGQQQIQRKVIIRKGSAGQKRTEKVSAAAMRPKSAHISNMQIIDVLQQQLKNKQQNGFRNDKAIVIQKYVKGWIIRKAYKPIMENERHFRQIQEKYYNQNRSNDLLVRDFNEESQLSSQHDDSNIFQDNMNKSPHSPPHIDPIDESLILDSIQKKIQQRIDYQTTLNMKLQSENVALLKQVGDSSGSQQLIKEKDVSIISSDHQEEKKQEQSPEQETIEQREPELIIIKKEKKELLVQSEYIQQEPKIHLIEEVKSFQEEKKEQEPHKIDFYDQVSSRKSNGSIMKDSVHLDERSWQFDRKSFQDFFECQSERGAKLMPTLKQKKVLTNTLKEYEEMIDLLTTEKLKKEKQLQQLNTRQILSPRSQKKKVDLEVWVAGREDDIQTKKKVYTQNVNDIINIMEADIAQTKKKIGQKRVVKQNNLFNISVDMSNNDISMGHLTNSSVHSTPRNPTLSLIKSKQFESKDSKSSIQQVLDKKHPFVYVPTQNKIEQVIKQNVSEIAEEHEDIINDEPLNIEDIQVVSNKTIRSAALHSDLNESNPIIADASQSDKPSRLSSEHQHSEEDFQIINKDHSDDQSPYEVIEQSDIQLEIIQAKEDQEDNSVISRILNKVQEKVQQQVEERKIVIIEEERDEETETLSQQEPPQFQSPTLSNISPHQNYNDDDLDDTNMKSKKKEEQSEVLVEAFLALKEPEQSINYQEQQVPLTLQEQQAEFLTDFILDLLLQQVRGNMFPKRVGLHPQREEEKHTIREEIIQQEEEKKAIAIQRRHRARGIKTQMKVVDQYISTIMNEIKGNEDEFVENLSTPLYKDPLDILSHLQNVFISEQEQENLVNFQQSVLPVDWYLKLEKEKLAIQCQDQLHEQEDIDYQDTNTSQLAEWENIHNKVIFDAINEALDNYRPYGLRGPPMPWSQQTRTLTYKNGQQVSNVLQNVRQKVMEWTRTFSGALPCSELLQEYGIKGPLDEDKLNLLREERLALVLASEIEENEVLWVDYEYEETQSKLDIADMILEMLADETTQELNKIKRERGGQ